MGFSMGFFHLNKALIGFSVTPEMSPSVESISQEPKHVEKIPWIVPQEHLHIKKI